MIFCIDEAKLVKTYTKRDYMQLSEVSDFSTQKDGGKQKGETPVD